MIRVRASPALSPKGFWRAGHLFVCSRAPQRSFPPGAVQYGVRRLKPVPDPQGTLRAGRSEAGSSRPDESSTNERRSTVAYLATVQLRGRGTVVVATASIDVRTVGMESELRGRATVARFDICAAIHPRSIRLVRMRMPIYNRPAPFISPLLSDHEKALFAIGHQ
jgi:hypothetical protein